MRIPASPPAAVTLATIPSKDLDQALAQVPSPLVNEKYVHWEKLRRLKPPENLTHEQWWSILKMRRFTLRRLMPLRDLRNNPFSYCGVDWLSDVLQQIDTGAAGRIEIATPLRSSDTGDRYYMASLVEEAISSSQLEGAATTRRVAEDMIRTGRKPRDRSEQMILNNYRAMRQLRELRDKPLTRELVCELHRVVTENTLDDASAAGRFRAPGESIRVTDAYGEVLHEPPPAAELIERCDRMCAFANGEPRGQFVHPVLRAILLHFWLAYDHPFVDGNGRTARALFYWCALHNGYWLFEFLSISQFLLQAPAEYARSFLHTETDGNDLTYFVWHQLEVIRRAIDELHHYVARRTKEIAALEARLGGLQHLNHRQQALVAHALRHAHFRYTIAGHQQSHNVTYQTARTDLLGLAEAGLLTSSKAGRTWNFSPVPDLEIRLQERAR